VSHLLANKFAAGKAQSRPAPTPHSVREGGLRAFAVANLFAGLSFFLSLLLLSLAGARPLAPAHLAHHAQVAAAPNAPIAYELAPEVSAPPRRLRVTMTFAAPPGANKVALQMPVWSPGDYHVQNHARYVQNVRAWEGDPADARPLVVAHPDPNTWEVQTAGAPRITLTYSLPETPPGIFSENIQLRAKQAFVNGPAAYLYLVGQKDRPATLTLRLPKDWRAETSLEPTPAPDEALVAFTAPDYDTLADAPVVMAAPTALETREFAYKNVPVRVVLFGDVGSVRDLDSYLPRLRKIVESESRLMQGFPCPRYRFLFEAKGRGGGLEHLNSSRIALWPEAGRREMALMAAHEFFHLWNVKRIRPRVLGPFDYLHPPRTRNLWFAEGVTQYYAVMSCLRAGLLSEEEFQTYWRNAMRAYQSNPARLRVTADEASLKVWEGGTSNGYGGLDYYEKGQLIGLCLDLQIRHVTGGARSLDDVMRFLMQQYGLPKPGYGEDDLRAAIVRVSGHDLSDFYDLLARSTEEMPFAECLARVGLDTDLRPFRNATPAQTALRARWLARY